MFFVFFIFFFQAEDGIRDWSVTGVQTCALPIWDPVDRDAGAHQIEVGLGMPDQPAAVRGVHVPRFVPGVPRRVDGGAEARSEERRVGKEGRYRGTTDM